MRLGIFCFGEWVGEWVGRSFLIPRPYPYFIKLPIPTLLFLPFLLSPAFSFRSSLLFSFFSSFFLFSIRFFHFTLPTVCCR